MSINTRDWLIIQLKNQKILQTSSRKTLRSLNFLRLNSIFNFLSHIFYSICKCFYCHLKIISFYLGTKTHLFINQLINLSFYSIGNCLLGVNKMIAHLVFENVGDHSLEFSFIQGTIFISMLTTFSNKVKFLILIHISNQSFFWCFSLVSKISNSLSRPPSDVSLIRSGETI